MEMANLPPESGRHFSECEKPRLYLIPSSQQTTVCAPDWRLRRIGDIVLVGVSGAYVDTGVLDSSPASQERRTRDRLQLTIGTADKTRDRVPVRRLDVGFYIHIIVCLTESSSMREKRWTRQADTNKRQKRYIPLHRFLHNIFR